ncbi:MAG: PIN domain-containing protein [Candidatus Sumerlaeota bacterium]|nr:PIN domain-containing protein [Candidatus Sumerlaeota bacterium]
MKSLFIDSSYFIAVLLRNDRFHGRVLQLPLEPEAARFVTTSLVVVEVLNHLAGMDPAIRASAGDWADDLQRGTDIEIVDITAARLREAVERYRKRPDQGWSLTDCASFLLMEERDIREALTFDRHFQQAGFVALGFGAGS